jgi:transcriptional regulator GlxA family with amidase domain
LNRCGAPISESARNRSLLQNWLELALAAKWSATTLAKNCGVSLRTLERHFEKYMGKSPKAWVLEERLLHAKELVQSGLRVKEAAGSLDYKHPNHLTNGFKDYWGYSPTNRPPPMRAQTT